MSYPVLKTELKNGFFCLFSNKFDFVFKIDNNVVHKMKVSKYTLQEAYLEYHAMLLEYKKNGTVISETEQQGLGFIAMSLNKGAKKRIKESLTGFSVEKLVDKEDYHFTLYYDLSNPIVQPRELSRDTELLATATDIQLLGNPDKLSAIAIVFESVQLEERFNDLKELGFKHDYETYIPHCTFKYSPTQEDVNLFINNKEQIIKQIGTIGLKKEHWRHAKIYLGK